MIYFIYICHIHLFHGNIYEVNTRMNVASSVQKVSYSKLLLNKSRCLNTMKSLSHQHLDIRVFSKRLYYETLAKHLVHDSDFVLLYIHCLAR